MVSSNTLPDALFFGVYGRRLPRLLLIIGILSWFCCPARHELGSPCRTVKSSSLLLSQGIAPVASAAGNADTGRCQADMADAGTRF